MAGSIRSEREFMDALRALKARSGLSYRDIARRMSRVAPQHAVSKSTLASLFAQDALPRRRGQLAALVSVLVLELDEPAEATSQYLADWSRLMTARSATAAGPTTASGPASPPEPEAAPQPEPAAPRAAPPATTPPVTGAPPGGYRVPLYRQPDNRQPDNRQADYGQAAYRQAEYWQPRYRAPEPAAPFKSPREYRSELARQLLRVLAILSALAFIFWAFLPNGGIPFWVAWIFFCWPVFLGAPFLLGRGPGYARSSAELPDDYLRIEHPNHPGPRR